MTTVHAKERKDRQSARARMVNGGEAGVIQLGPARKTALSFLPRNARHGVSPASPGSLGSFLSAWAGSRLPGCRMTAILDPDGNTIAMHQRKPAAPIQQKITKTDL